MKRMTTNSLCSQVHFLLTCWDRNIAFGVNCFDMVEKKNYAQPYSGAYFLHSSQIVQITVCLCLHLRFKYTQDKFKKAIDKQCYLLHSPYIQHKTILYNSKAITRYIQFKNAWPKFSSFRRMDYTLYFHYDIFYNIACNTVL